LENYIVNPARSCLAGRMEQGGKKVGLHIRVIAGDDLVMGWGRADLLGLIEETGSIAAAGRRMNMSYKRAWALVETMNRTFKTPLVAAAKGGAGGGGAHLTSLGREVLAAYRAVERAAAAAGAEPLAALSSALREERVPPQQKSR
jgi:molybdate transport system regulatory protein